MASEQKAEEAGKKTASTEKPTSSKTSSPESREKGGSDGKLAPKLPSSGSGFEAAARSSGSRGTRTSRSSHKSRTPNIRDGPSSTSSLKHDPGRPEPAAGRDIRSSSANKPNQKQRQRGGFHHGDSFTDSQDDSLGPQLPRMGNMKWPKGAREDGGALLRFNDRFDSFGPIPGRAGAEVPRPPPPRSPIYSNELRSKGGKDERQSRSPDASSTRTANSGFSSAGMIPPRGAGARDLDAGFRREPNAPGRIHGRVSAEAPKGLPHRFPIDFPTDSYEFRLVKGGKNQEQFESRDASSTGTADLELDPHELGDPNPGFGREQNAPGQMSGLIPCQTPGRVGVEAPRGFPPELPSDFYDDTRPVGAENHRKHRQGDGFILSGGLDFAFPSDSLAPPRGRDQDPRPGRELNAPGAIPGGVAAGFPKSLPPAPWNGKPAGGVNDRRQPQNDDFTPTGAPNSDFSSQADYSNPKLGREPNAPGPVPGRFGAELPKGRPPELWNDPSDTQPPVGRDDRKQPRIDDFTPTGAADSDISWGPIHRGRAGDPDQRPDRGPNAPVPWAGFWHPPMTAPEDRIQHPGPAAHVPPNEGIHGRQQAGDGITVHARPRAPYFDMFRDFQDSTADFKKDLVNKGQQPNLPRGGKLDFDDGWNDSYYSREDARHRPGDRRDDSRFSSTSKAGSWREPPHQQRGPGEEPAQGGKGIDRKDFGKDSPSDLPNAAPQHRPPWDIPGRDMGFDFGDSTYGDSFYPEPPKRGGQAPVPPAGSHDKDPEGQHPLPNQGPNDWQPPVDPVDQAPRRGQDDFGFDERTYYDSRGNSIYDSEPREDFGFEPIPRPRSAPDNAPGGKGRNDPTLPRQIPPWSHGSTYRPLLAQPGAPPLPREKAQQQPFVPDPREWDQRSDTSGAPNALPGGDETEYNEDFQTPHPGHGKAEQNVPGPPRPASGARPGWDLSSYGQGPPPAQGARPGFGWDPDSYSDKGPLLARPGGVDKFREGDESKFGESSLTQHPEPGKRPASNLPGPPPQRGADKFPWDGESNFDETYQTRLPDPRQGPAFNLPGPPPALGARPRRGWDHAPGPPPPRGVAKFPWGHEFKIDESSQTQTRRPAPGKGQEFSHESIQESTGGHKAIPRPEGGGRPPPPLPFGPESGLSRDSEKARPGSADPGAFDSDLKRAIKDRQLPSDIQGFDSGIFNDETRPQDPVPSPGRGAPSPGCCSSSSGSSDAQLSDMPPWQIERLQRAVPPGFLPRTIRPKDGPAMPDTKESFEYAPDPPDINKQPSHDPKGKDESSWMEEPFPYGSGSSSIASKAPSASSTRPGGVSSPPLPPNFPPPVARNDNASRLGFPPNFRSRPPPASIDSSMSGDSFRPPPKPDRIPKAPVPRNSRPSGSSRPSSTRQLQPGKPSEHRTISSWPSSRQSSSSSRPTGGSSLKAVDEGPRSRPSGSSICSQRQITPPRSTSASKTRESIPIPLKSTSDKITQPSRTSQPSRVSDARSSRPISKGPTEPVPAHRSSTRSGTRPSEPKPSQAPPAQSQCSQTSRALGTITPAKSYRPSHRVETKVSSSRHSQPASTKSNKPPEDIGRAIRGESRTSTRPASQRSSHHATPLTKPSHSSSLKPPTSAPSQASRHSGTSSRRPSQPSQAPSGCSHRSEEPAPDVPPSSPPAQPSSRAPSTRPSTPLQVPSQGPQHSTSARHSQGSNRSAVAPPPQGSQAHSVRSSKSVQPQSPKPSHSGSDRSTAQVAASPAPSTPPSQRPPSHTSTSKKPSQSSHRSKPDSAQESRALSVPAMSPPPPPPPSPLPSERPPSVQSKKDHRSRSQSIHTPGSAKSARVPPDPAPPAASVRSHSTSHISARVPSPGPSERPSLPGVIGFPYPASLKSTSRRGSSPSNKSNQPVDEAPADKPPQSRTRKFFWRDKANKDKTDKDKTNKDQKKDKTDKEPPEEPPAEPPADITPLQTFQKYCPECGKRSTEMAVSDFYLQDRSMHLWRCDPCDLGFCRFRVMYTAEGKKIEEPVRPPPPAAAVTEDPFFAPKGFHRLCPKCGRRASGRAFGKYLVEGKKTNLWRCKKCDIEFCRLKALIPGAGSGVNKDELTHVEEDAVQE